MHSLAKTGQTSSALGVLHWMRGIACFALSMCLAQAATAQLRYAGSDTVEPMIEAAQVSFARGHAGYKLQIQANGTSAGFRELCTGRAALIGASRPIKPDEAQTCATANIQQIEVPMALDAIVLVASTKNNWLKELTFAEVRTLFDPASTSKLTSWKQLRPGFPDAPIKTAGVGIKHGTFGFFSDSLGLKGYIRSDFKDFNDHGSTGRFVAAEQGGGIGFMALGDALAMESQLRILGIDFGSGAVVANADAVLSGRYDKLARTVYLYMNPAMVATLNPTDKDFLKSLVNDADKLVRFANLIPLRGLQYQENMRRVNFSR
jgi:phosphate transport system substrate-binding protein